MSKILEEDEVMIGGNIMKKNDAAYTMPIGLVLISIICFMFGSIGWGIFLFIVSAILTTTIAVRQYNIK